MQAGAWQDNCWWQIDSVMSGAGNPKGWPHITASPFHLVALFSTCCAIARRMAGSRTGIKSSLANSNAALHGRQAAHEAVFVSHTPRTAVAAMKHNAEQAVWGHAMLHD